MLRSILVGLDGSPHSRDAAALGIDWARRYDAVLVGLGVIDEPEICRPEMVPIGASAIKREADEARLAQATGRVQQFLEQFSVQCAQAGVSSKVVQVVGDPAEQIVRQAQRYDLILLGHETHFHFATQEDACATLEKVLRNAPRPVARAAPAPQRENCVVVAYDGSVQAARALQAFQTLLNRSPEVHVLTVGEDVDEVTQHVNRAVEFLGFHGITARPRVVSSSAPIGTVLLEEARRLNAGLMVMGAYGQPVVKEFFLGSVTRTLLKDGALPLFMFH